MTKAYPGSRRFRLYPLEGNVGIQSNLFSKPDGPTHGSTPQYPSSPPPPSQLRHRECVLLLWYGVVVCGVDDIGRRHALNSWRVLACLDVVKFVFEWRCCAFIDTRC